MLNMALMPQVRSMTARILTLTALVLVGSTPAHADAELQTFLEKALAWLQDRDHDPAIAALIQIDGQVAAEAATGHRALGHDELVTLDDRGARRDRKHVAAARSRRSQQRPGDRSCGSPPSSEMTLAPLARGQLAWICALRRVVIKTSRCSVTSRYRRRPESASSWAPSSPS